MTEESKEFYKLINALKQEICQDVDSKTILLNKLGLVSERNLSKKKLTHISEAVKKKKSKVVNIYDSVYTMGVQRSNYI